MDIEYEYEIVSVDEQSRCMEIIYTAVGHPIQHIGARLPYEGESLEDVVRMYSPVAYWNELKRKVVPPEVGIKGAIQVVPDSLPENVEQPISTGAKDF